MGSASQLANLKGQILAQHLQEGIGPWCEVFCPVVLSATESDGSALGRGNPKLSCQWIAEHTLEHTCAPSVGFPK